MKTNYKEMSIKELIVEESKLRNDLFKLTFQNKVGQLADNSKIKLTKKDIARVKTAIKQKQLVLGSTEELVRGGAKGAKR